MNSQVILQLLNRYLHSIAISLLDFFRSFSGLGRTEIMLGSSTHTVLWGCTEYLSKAQIYLTRLPIQNLG